MCICDYGDGDLDESGGSVECGYSDNGDNVDGSDNGMLEVEMISVVEEVEVTVSLVEVDVVVVVVMIEEMMEVTRKVVVIGTLVEVEM